MKNKSVTILILCVTMLLIVEFGLRMSGKYKTVQEKMGFGYVSDYGKTMESHYHNWDPSSIIEIKNTEFEIDHHVNKHGFRDSEFKKSNDGAKNVLIIGDSFIEGVGAEAHETFPAILQQLISDSLYRICNIGMSASDVFFGYKQMQRLIDGLQPSHIILTMNSTDVDEFIPRSGLERFQQDGTTKFRQPGIRHKLFRRSHLMRFIFLDILQLDYSLLNQRQLDKMHNEAIDQIEDCVNQAARLCAEKDIKFLFTAYPIFNEICQAGLDNMLYQRVDPKLQFLDLTDYLLSIRSQVDCREYGWRQDGHFNAKGYAFMANSFYDAVNENYPHFWDD